MHCSLVEVWNATAGTLLGQVKSAAPIVGLPRDVWLWGVIAGVLAVAGVLYSRSDAVGQRLMISRVLLLIVACVRGSYGGNASADIVAMVAWAFSLAAAGIFPALVLGVWWKGTTRSGAIVGMIVGFSLCLFYLIITRYWPHIGVQYFGMSSLAQSDLGQSVDLGSWTWHATWLTPSCRMVRCWPPTRLLPASGGSTSTTSLQRCSRCRWASSPSSGVDVHAEAVSRGPGDGRRGPPSEGGTHPRGQGRRDRALTSLEKKTYTNVEGERRLALQFIEASSQVSLRP